jgi:gamma-glutamyltranspeptidase / glutathione hydrolase
MHGAVAAGHPASAEAGARVLAEGGNAVDALLAAAFAAFVAEGPLTGPTGGGFLLLHEPHGATTVLDCFFAAPEAPFGVMEEVIIDFADTGSQAFHVGDGSVAVPGLLAGLEEAHRRYATRAWEELLEPALALARADVACDAPRRFLHGILAPILLRDEGGRRVYGEPDRVSTEELGATLELIRDRGAAAVATILPEYATDLARYTVAEHRPLVASYRGNGVLTTPPPSRGGEIVAVVLASLGDAFPLDLTRLADALARGYGGPADGLLTGTTHISTVDAQGTAAALSSTLGSGSGVFRGGCQLNNMLGELDVIGTGTRAAGDRLPSMMTPTLVLDGDDPRLVLGSAGSVRLAGAIAQVVARVIGGEPVAEAIAAPRLHPDGRTLHVEAGWSETEIAGLGDGWDVVRWGGTNLFFGGVGAVEHRPDGTLAAAGDPRRGGHGVVIP